LKSAKITLLIIFIGLIGIALGSYASNRRLQRQASIEHINSMLYDLNIELDLFEYWELEYKNDYILEEKIKHLILNNMLALLAIKPNTENLRGVPLQALDRLIDLNENTSLSIKKYDSAFKNASDYLVSIKDDVKSAVNKRKRILREH
jgi:hypothetical protein